MRKNTTTTNQLNKNKPIERVSRLPRLTHMEQMRRAYNSKNNMYFDEQTGTLSISGTHLPTPSNQFSVKDLITDIKVPFKSWFENDQRFLDAEKFFINNRSKIKAIQGHSLGSAISEHLNDKYNLDKDNVKIYLYAAPRISIHEKKRNVKSYRHFNDIISVFDRSAMMSKTEDINPHNYTGYEELEQNRIDYGEFLSKEAIDK